MPPEVAVKLSRTEQFGSSKYNGLTQILLDALSPKSVWKEKSSQKKKTNVPLYVMYICLSSLTVLRTTAQSFPNSSKSERNVYTNFRSFVEMEYWLSTFCYERSKHGSAAIVCGSATVVWPSVGIVFASVIDWLLAKFREPSREI